MWRPIYNSITTIGLGDLYKQVPATQMWLVTLLAPVAKHCSISVVLNIGSLEAQHFRWLFFAVQQAKLNTLFGSP